MKELQLKKPSFARAVWKAENSTMIVIIVRVENYVFNFTFFQKFAYFATLMIVMSMIAATMNFISLTFIGLLIDWFGDNEVLGTRRTSL